MITSIIPVNLQEGLLLIGNDVVIGGYSHYLKVVIVNVPYRLSEIELPVELEGYEIIAGFTDSCYVGYWHGATSTDTRAHELVRWYKLKKGGGV